MKRRNLIAAIGAVTAGGAAVGTGAFTSVEAERSASISIADEDTGLLALTALDTDEGGFVIEGDRNELRFDFNQADSVGGSGTGSKSVYKFDRLFAIENQGTQTVYVDSEFQDAEEEGLFEEGYLDDIGLYIEEVDEHFLDGEDAALKLEPGDSADIGFEIDTGKEGVPADFQNSDDLDTELSAVDEEPEGVTILDEDGEEVGNGPTG